MTSATFRRLGCALWLAILLAVVSVAQEPKTTKPVWSSLPQNLGMENGELGRVPSGWRLSEVSAMDGYKLGLSEDKPFAGKRCAVLSRAGAPKPEGFGNVMQVVDAAKYRGQRVRFRAAVRADVNEAGNQAQLWLRVNRPKDQMGFFDNMDDRPINSKEWKHYEIVGDIDADAESIVFGMILIGHGVAALDDVSFEVVDPAKFRPTVRPTPAPGLTEVVMAATVTSYRETSATYLYPLPLSYRDQAPLTFRLTVDPPAAAKSVEIVAGSGTGAGDNRVLKLTLHELDKHKKVHVEYRSLVLVAPTAFEGVPKSAAFPKAWPAEARPWLASTWCVEHDDARVKALAKEIRGDADDVMVVIANTLTRAKRVFGSAKGKFEGLTAIDALDKQGSCTSNANLVAALLRGSGIPARIVAGYPTWSGPLQTHYIVEAYVPGYGWYPVESTMCRAPWPNFQQINVSIVPVENESRAKAGLRNRAIGGVPYLSLTELEDNKADVYSRGALTTAEPYCDHECQLIRAMTASDAEWSETMTWGRTRWSAWLKSRPELINGAIEFGPARVTARTPAEVREQVK